MSNLVKETKEMNTEMIVDNHFFLGGGRWRDVGQAELESERVKEIKPGRN